MLGNVVLGVPLAFTILAALVVALRVYVRASMKTGLSWDDWTMLLAAVSISEICHMAPRSSTDLDSPSKSSTEP